MTSLQGSRFENFLTVNEGQGERLSVVLLRLRPDPYQCRRLRTLPAESNVGFAQSRIRHQESCRVLLFFRATIGQKCRYQAAQTDQ